jgi:hypothetical protein
MKCNNISLVIIIVIIFGLLFGVPLFYNIIKSIKMIEKYQNYQNYDIYNNNNTNLGADNSKFPFTENNVLLEDSYPLTGRNGISDNSANNIWWHKPIFKVGSYEQITNNIRYSNNPDVGSCMPASMCGALYKDKQLKTNYVKPLPPINPECGTRIGYFDTNINLLPFRTDMANILY